MYRRLCGILIAAALVFPAYAQDSGKMAPLNPKFEAWRESHSLSRKPLGISVPVPGTPSPQRITGKRPAPLNLHHLYNQSIAPSARKAMDATGGFPVRFDLRENHKVTVVKNQNPWGTCWSFAALGSSESSALVQGWQNPDFSEKHLAYYAFTDINETLVGFDINPEHSLYEQGANAPIPMAMLSRWTGIVAEEDAPYKDFDTAPPADAPNVALLRKALIAPAGEHFVNNVKYLLQNSGAVNIDVYVDLPEEGEEDPTFNDSFNPETGAFYYTGDSEEGNHAVLAVGWDDTYPKENFLQEPPGDGAWIVQNSWGTEWGDDGYFYVSYYDAFTGKYPGEDAYAYVITRPENYDIIHFHDPLGATGAYATGDDSQAQWFSNIFHAEEDQNLKAAGLYTLSPHAELTLSVYTSPDPSNPSSGVLAFGPWTITKEIPGYHVIDLEREVPLQKSQSFSIVVRIQTQDTEPPIAIEGPQEAYSSKATARKGQSFISADGNTWKDMTDEKADTNVCLKALSTQRSPDPEPVESCFIRALFR